jgi:hypothetical protein
MVTVCPTWSSLKNLGIWPGQIIWLLQSSHKVNIKYSKAISVLNYTIKHDAMKTYGGVTV